MWFGVFLSSVLGGWGSGTGGAGVAGAFIYAAMTQAGLSPQITLLIMLVVPLAMLIRSEPKHRHPNMSSAGV